MKATSGTHRPGCRSPSCRSLFSGCRGFGAAHRVEVSSRLREEVMGILTVPARRPARVRAAVPESLPSWAPWPRARRSRDVGRLAEHREHERGHLGRGDAARTCLSRNVSRVRTALGLSSGEGHRYRFELEAPEPSRVIGDMVCKRVFRRVDVPRRKTRLIVRSCPWCPATVSCAAAARSAARAA